MSRGDHRAQLNPEVKAYGRVLDASGFDSWQDLMRGIEAGLLMLGKGRDVLAMMADVVDKRLSARL